MDTSKDTLSNLFDQLGLESDSDSIKTFIKEHRIEDGVSLADAEFWTAAQSAFIEESMLLDSDWVIPLGHLDASLRD